MKFLTKKLFFRKYAFKVELTCKGANIIKRRGINVVIEQIRSGASIVARDYWGRPSGDDGQTNATLLEFAEAVRPILKKEFKCRAEHNHFTFFLENRKDFDLIQKKLAKWVTSTWEPSNDSELDFLTDNKRKVIVDKLPHEKYVNKVVFKSNWDSFKRQSFYQWLKKYPEDDFKVSPSTHRYLTGSARYCAAPFLYIADPKMLTMLTLFAGDHVSYIEEFVPRHTLLP